MHKHGQNETLNFTGFSGYYGPIPDGYGGFDWTGLDYLNKSDLVNGSQHSETGYQNAIKGHSEAIFGINGGGSYGLIGSMNVSETFSLKSMIAASGGQTDEQIGFRTYTYGQKGFVLKASDTITLGQTAEKIDFAKFGGDFQNISAVLITGSYGYGYGYDHHSAGTHARPSYLMAFDHLKVHWNGTIPNGAGIGVGRHPALPHVHHTIAAHLAMPGGESGGSQHAEAGGESGGYHSAIMSLDAALGHADPGSGLTGQFALPQLEHFGT